MLKPQTERRLLQITIFLGALVPLAAGGAGILLGAKMMGRGIAFNADLDSHFRYLSGLLLGIGAAYMSTIPRIEGRLALFQALSLIVIAGGLSRLLGRILEGPPGGAHQFALVMELVVVPLLLLWVRRVGTLEDHQERTTKLVSNGAKMTKLPHAL